MSVNGPENIKLTRCIKIRGKCAPDSKTAGSRFNSDIKV